MAATLIRRGPPLRSHLDLTKAEEVRYWTKHFNVETARLAEAIAKVGNSAAAIRKELNLATPSQREREG